MILMKLKSFWRKLVLCEEDRRQLIPWRPWVAGYRWFRSPNVVPIEYMAKTETGAGAEALTAAQRL